MRYHEAVAQNLAAHPLRVERWSEPTERWVFVSDEKTHEGAERRIAMAQITRPGEYRITDQKEANR